MKSRKSIIFLSLMMVLILLIASSCGNKSSRTGDITNLTQTGGNASVSETLAVVQSESNIISINDSTITVAVSTTKRTTAVSKTTQQTKSTATTKLTYLPYDAYDSKISDALKKEIFKKHTDTDPNGKGYDKFDDFYGVFNGKPVYSLPGFRFGANGVYNFGKKDEYKIYQVSPCEIYCYTSNNVFVYSLDQAYDRGFLDDEDAIAVVKKANNYGKEYEPNKLTVTIADGHIRNNNIWKPEDFSGAKVDITGFKIKKVTDITKEREAAYQKSGMKRYINKLNKTTQYLEIEFEYQSENNQAFWIAKSLETLPFVRSADVIYLLDRNGNYISLN